MFIKHSNGVEESHPVCPQRLGEDFIGDLARRHDFRILTGVYPTWATDSDLEQLLHELSVIRAAVARDVEANGWLSAEERARGDQRWARLIDMLKPLANERGWEVTFG